MKTQNLRARLVATALLLGAQLSAHSGEQQPLVTVYSDVVGASELLAGNYAQALKLMADSKQENGIFMQNNLCVAHILNNNFVDAQRPCATALEEAQRSSNYGEWLERTKSTRVRRMYRERALRHLQLLDDLNREVLVNTRP